MLQRLLGRFKIKSKLVLIYSVLMIFTTLIASAFTYYYSKNILVENSVNYTLTILEQTVNSITDKLQQIDENSDLLLSNQIIRSSFQYHPNLASSSEELDLTNKINSVLAGTILSNRYIESIAMYDFQGRKYRTKSVGEELSFEQAKKLAESGDGSMVWGGLMNDNRTIPAIKLIFSYDMKPLGVLVFYINEGGINKLFSEQLAKINGDIYIVGGNQIISSVNEEMVGGTLDEGIMRQIPNEEDDAGNDGYFYGTFEGKKKLVTYYPSKVNTWKFICIIPMSEIVEQASQLWKFNALFAILAAALFILLTVLITNTITKPINRITRKMNEIHLGQIITLQRYEGNDEITYLSDAFQKMVVRINRLVEEVYEQKLLRSQQELKALQAQINPHFLYNTLEIVNWMSRSSGAPQIGRIVIALSGMMRYSIEGEEEMVAVADELGHIRNYFTIQMKRFGDKLQIRYDIDEEILECRMIKLSLQPIVENCIVHGFKPKDGAGRIDIAGFLSEDRLCIRISDDGGGIPNERLPGLLLSPPAEETEEHTGIGINNVHKRLQIKFGKEFGLKISSGLNEGTTVEMRLPIIRKDETK